MKIALLVLKFFPQIIFYFFSKNKQLIDKDVDKSVEHLKIKNNIVRLVIVLQQNLYYREVFSHRIGYRSFLFTSSHDFYVNRKTIIGPGFRPVHSYATIINAKSIGKNFVCRNCTTIGNKFDGLGKCIPSIGDNVIVGANVVIIGEIKIGNNVIIGAGSVVIKDIPDNTIVAGNPAKIIKSNS